MKKTYMITIISFMILGLTTMGMATTASGTGGSITIGALVVDTSANGLIRYSSESGAGGYAAAAAGNQWAVTTASSKGEDTVALEFMMRGSQESEDNELYQQLLTGGVPDDPTDLSDPAGGLPSALGFSTRN